MLTYNLVKVYFLTENINNKLPWQFSSEEFKQINMTQINFSYSCLESQKSIWKLYQSDSQTTVFTFKWFSLPLDTWLISSLRFCHDIRIKKIEFCVFSEPWEKAKEAFAWLEKLQKDCIYCRRQYVRLFVHCILYVPTIALPCWGGWKNKIP